MSAGRFRATYSLDLRRSVRRPLFWILLILLTLLAWGLSNGSARIGTGDSSVGGTKAFITSQYAVAQMLAATVFIFYAFFIAVAAGMTVIQDEELKLDEILHSTPLHPREYVWGKFLAVLTAFGVVLAVHLAVTILLNHRPGDVETADYRGPFGMWNYLRPALVFGLPPIVFLAGTAFWVGERTRKPILVFVLPVALIMLAGFFLWSWSPGWLDPAINRALMLIDPSGFRWLNETWLKVDKGVDFYNAAPIGFDAPFLVSRLAFVLVGLWAVMLSHRHFAATLTGSGTAKRKHAPAMPMHAPGQAEGMGRAAARAGSIGKPLAALQMRTRRPGFFFALWHTARVELRELSGSPGLYLFIPIILLQVIGNATVAVGAFDTRLLLTPGQMASSTANALTLLVCLLLLFYNTESLLREKRTGLAPIRDAMPVSTLAILMGKTVANSLIAVVVLVATLLTCLVVLAVQGTVPISIWPFVQVWGLLIPTFLVWSAFVTLVHAISKSRYTTYAFGLVALIATMYFQFQGDLNWVSNWALWSMIGWTDMGAFELDGRALLLNRVLVLALAVFFLRVAVLASPRVERDSARTLSAFRPAILLRGLFALAPWALIPFVTGVTLWTDIEDGWQGSRVERDDKDTWKKHFATWKDADLPSLAAVDLDIELEPARRWFRVDGSYVLENRTGKTLRQVPMTVGSGWRHRIDPEETVNFVAWTRDSGNLQVDDMTTRLHVLTLDPPLAAGESMTLGFGYETEFPRGATRAGGGAAQFVLPSGVVMHAFQPNFVPLIGFVESLGVDEDNSYEPKQYADDFYVGETEPLYGSGVPYTVRMEVTAPEDYTVNGVGQLMSKDTADGLTTVVWQTDRPVQFFNLVAGRWDLRRGNGTAIYYHPEHDYNIDAMLVALDAAREHYGEWFAPFPWAELKLSEFPGLATYAQGFPTNITFSEGIGFLTKGDERADAAFMVTAHEAAHQWWGNILVPGEGPGGAILGEGMSHYSTMLLTEEVKGERARMELCKRFEERYGDGRVEGSERPMVRTDGSKSGDQVVIYEKGGWVMWMLTDLMGRENALAGLREFVATYRDGPDFPVLQDLLATLRPHAPDTDAFDDFAQQWFHEVVLPRYELSRVELAPGAAGGWMVTARITNEGTGRMAVEIAAASGERFAEDGEVARADTADEDTGYREARTLVTLGPGQSETITMPCDFEPDRIVVDPDVRVLQLNRDAAIHDF